VRAFVVLFLDAWRESRDRRAVQVLLIFGAAIALGCLGLGFETPTPAAALAGEAQKLATFERGIALFRSARTDQPKPELEHEVSAVRGPTADDDLPSGLDDPHVVEIRMRDLPALDGLVRAWARFTARRAGAAAVPPAASEIGRRERADFLRERFEHAGFTDVIARPIDGDERAWRIAATASRPAELRSPWKLGWFFGAFDQEVTELSPAEMVLSIEVGVANGFVGLVGILIVLVTFASSIPEMVRKGAIELVLARPIGRVRLLLLRYAAAVAAVLMVTSGILAACGISLWIKSGVADPRLVLCGATATAVFAILFPVSMLLGVTTRNPTLATLGSIGFWAAASFVVHLRESLEFFGDLSVGWKRTLDVAHACLPKTGDFDQLNALFLARSNLSSEAAARLIDGHAPVVDWWYSAGTSAAFAAVVLALTVWIFRRRDW
jgi:ABC-type transport system involved in multi-copper enzyme maturation permease subunit